MFRPDERLHFPERQLEYFLIQENHGIQRLILRRGTDSQFFRQMSQELPHLRIAHFRWMALMMENHKPPDPTGVGFLRAETIVPKPDGASNPVQKLLRL